MIIGSVRRVLILLPPSEGKTAPPTGPSLDLGTLSFEALTPVRRKVLAALVDLSRRDPRAAARALGLGPTQGEEVTANARLRRAPAGPAITIYSGVLYEALDWATLAAAERRRVNASVAIASALFGLVRPQDRIPAYRLSGDTTLPGIGTLTGAWREQVSDQLAASRGVILDLRSGAYVALGPLPESTWGRAVTGRVLLERNGKRSVVSHHNKATKGRIVRQLAQAGAAPRSVDALMNALHDLGYRLELHEQRAGAPVLDIVVREL